MSDAHEQKPELEQKPEPQQVAPGQLPPKKYRIQTAQDIAGQTKFTTWYIQTLREAYQAEPKTVEFLAAVNLCATLLGGEANLLGIQRTIALFGEELVTACAWQARELHLAGRATEVTGRADRTVGGTFFYLLHKWYDAQPSANPPAQPQAQVQTGEPVTVAEPLLPWAQLKIPYLYPKPADCVSPELTKQEPARVFNYSKLREELSRLTERVLQELGTATLTEYAPPSASLSAIFTVLSSPVVEPASTQRPLQPAQTSTSLPPPEPEPPTVTSLGSEMGQTATAAAGTEISAKAGTKTEAQTAAITEATNNPTRLAAEEEANPAAGRAFLQALANIYGEAVVYGTGKNSKSKSKRSNW